MNYNIRIAGVTAENRQEILKTLPLKYDLKFSIMPEPENPYDSNAIAVYTEDNRKIGYIPKDKNKMFLEKLKDGVKFNITGCVIGGKDESQNFGVMLKFNTENDNEEIEFFNFKK